MIPPAITAPVDDAPAEHIVSPPGFEGRRRNAVPPPAFVRARVNPLLLAMWRALPHDAQTADDLERCAASGGIEAAVDYLRGVLRSCDDTAAACPELPFVRARAAAVEASRVWIASGGSL